MLHIITAVVITAGAVVSGQSGDSGAGGNGAFPFPVPWATPAPGVISEGCLWVPPGKQFPEGWMCPDGVSPPPDFP